jgi:hypothetical protein
MSRRDRDEGRSSTGEYGAAYRDGYASCAWRLIGLFRSEAGWLDLREDRLRYFTPAGVVFAVPLAEVSRLVFPWYYFGGGLKLTVGGEEYRFSFVVPNGAQYPELGALIAEGDPASLAPVAQKAQDAGASRGVGHEWRRLLDGRTAS